MTREEIVNSMSLQDAIQVLKDTNCYGTMDIAKTVILKALEQEPCTDAISRKAVLEIIRKCHCEEWIKADIGAPIEALSSVTPAEKVGQWINAKVGKMFPSNDYKCSLCGNILNFDGVNCGRGDANYCPKCGCRMVEPQEKEPREDVSDINDGNIYECPCGYGWDKNKVVRHHFCPNCGRAVNSTEQEPCDAVSRKEVMNMLHNHAFDYATSTKILALLKTMYGEVDRMPSVTPQYTEAEIQKMQELEQAEIQKAYELGKAEMQPCEDAISRQAAIDARRKTWN